MRQFFAQLLVLALLIGFPGTVRANDLRWIWQGGEKKWQSHFEADYAPGNHDRQALVLSPFAVLAEDDQSLIFVNIRNTFFWQDSDFADEINVGAGYRRLMGDSGSWILGGYAFYDHLESLYNNSFDQGTLGIETMSQDWDLRMNGYISDMDQEFVGGTGKKIQLSGTQLTMNGTVEQAMSGLDGEVGWRLPFATEGWLGDTRVYAGGFFFDASKVSSIAGPSTRFETRIHDIPGLWEGSRITLGAQYTWDHVRNSNVTGLISLRVPFGAPSRSKPLTYVERRMTDRVVRDVAVVTNLGAGSSESVVTGTGAPIEEAFFFDYDTDDPSCTLENPCSIEDAIDKGENKLLIGLNLTGDINLSGSHQLFNGQTVMGGGSGLVVYGANSGQSITFFAPGGPATLCCVGTALTLAENNTIEGLTFRSMGNALYLSISDTTTKVDIYNNSFRNLGTSASLNLDGNSALTARVWSNLFENQGTGVELFAEDTFAIDLQVTDNIFRNMGTGIYAELNPTGEFGPSSWNDAIHRNSFEDMDSGINVNVAFEGSENYTHVSSVYENFFRNLDWDDYELNVNGSSPSGAIDLSVNLTENRSEDGDTFFDMEMDPIPYGQVDLQIVNNDIEDVDDDAINVYVYAGPDVTANISGNRIENVGGDAIRLGVGHSGDENGHTLTIADNQIREVYEDGIEIFVQKGYDADVVVTGNDIAEVGGGEDGGDAINVSITNNGNDQGNTANISGNTLNAVEDDGIDVYFAGGLDDTLTVTENAISDVGGDGVEVDFFQSGHDQGNTATISHNLIDGASEDGIHVYFGDGYDSSLTIADNTIEDVGEDGGDGIEVTFYSNGIEGGPGDSATITGNSVDRASDDGIDVYFEFGDSDATSLTLTNNTLSSLGGDGAEIDFYDNDGYGESATISGNTVSDAGSDGIDVSSSFGPDATLTIAGNTIERVESTGIRIDLYEQGSDSGNTVNVTGNQITDADIDGIDFDARDGYDTDVVVSGNTITNVGDDGDGDAIRVSFYDNGSYEGDTATITGNTIDEAQDDGIEVSFVYGFDGTATIAGNTISNVDDDGIFVYFEDNGHDVGNTASVTGNSIDGAGGDGIDVYLGYDDASIDVSSNQVNDAERGIYAEFYGAGNVTASIANNTITDVERDGIGVRLRNSDANLIAISGNQITGSAIVPDPVDCEGCGIGVLLEADSDDNEIVINGNSVSHSDFIGIGAGVIDGSSSNTVRIGGNFVDQSDVYGIYFDSDDASNTLTSEVNGSIQDNTVLNSGINDYALDGPFTGTIRVNGVDVP